MDELNTPVFRPKTLVVRFDPEGDPNRPWITVGEHSFSVGPIHWRVPDGFRTDFTSHPRWLAKALLVASVGIPFFPNLLWVLYPLALFSLFIRDPLGKQQRAALFHDHGYADQAAGKSITDSAYRYIMRLDRVNPIRVFLHYYGVVLFGGLAWWTHKRRKK